MDSKSQNERSDSVQYDTRHMKFLTDLDHVRTKSAMYIGDLGENGLHHLVHEVIDNSIDEVMAGYASRITVEVKRDHSIAIEDDGRGIPVAHDENIGKSALEGAMTVLKYSGKFDNEAYVHPGGLHGMGLKTVNFLSEWCRVTVSRNGRQYRQRYERGKPIEEVQDIGDATSAGTRTEFLPDRKKFGELVFDYANLRRRVQDAAFLNRGVQIEFIDQRKSDAPAEVFQYERGLTEFIEHRNRDRKVVHADVVFAETTVNDVAVDFAFQYVVTDIESVECYANNILNQDGGMHLKGFRAGLIRALRAYGKQQKLFRKKQPTSEDFREGLVAVVSVRLGGPEFESQHKLRLVNAHVEPAVGAAVSKQVARFLEENPTTARAILKRVMLATEARELARSKKQAIEKSMDWGGGGLPGKLRDCTSSDVARRELYLVEGDSAGGSAEGGRLRDTQAILPLRGKMINAYKSRDEKVLSNGEVQSIIQAIGIGIGSDQELEDRRYERIIIMTDADVDGSHIRTLLLCFFYRQMYDLIAAGHVFVALPPLFRVRHRRETYYVQTEAEMREQLFSRGIADTRLATDQGQTISGEDLKRLCDVLAKIEDAIVRLERRGINLKTHAERADVVSGLLPAFRCVTKEGDAWSTKSSSDSIEHTEIQSINLGLTELFSIGFDITCLFPIDRTGNELPRYVLHHDTNETHMDDLRSLLPAIRSIGEKGLQVTRFKGLGEMNADELRETTLDPANRTLVQITMEDVAAADQMFNLLMGHEVQPRRSFIEQNALNVAKLDV